MCCSARMAYTREPGLDRVKNPRDDGVVLLSQVVRETEGWC